MSTVLQQLRAEYEASTQGEWSVFARQGLNPGDEEWFLGYEIAGPEQPSRGQFVRRADAALCVAAHNKMPLLLAVAEAAVAWEAARRADVFAMRKVIAAIEPADVDRTDEADKAHIKTADALATSEAALCALVTPLLEDEE